eukprot:jgi/Bigna1/86889/estExt_fgenesh1_pg.C_140219
MMSRTWDGDEVGEMKCPIADFRPGRLLGDVESQNNDAGIKTTPIIQYIGSKAGSEGSPTSSLSDENQVQSAKKEEEEKWCLLENHPYHNMLKKHQFPSSCANKRFLIYLPPGMGFGAYLGSIAGVMEYALNTNRILILHQDFNAGWFAGVTKENCPSGTSQAYECYFKPLTNCTEQEALEAVGLTSVNQMLRNSSHRKTNDEARPDGFLVFSSSHVYHLLASLIKLTPFPPMYFMIGDNPMRTVIGARYYNYENLYKNEVARLKTNAKEIRTEDSINDPMGYIISYLIRPNAWMAKILKGTFEEIIPKTILARAKNRHRGVLSLPIRGSDKCGTPVGAKSKHSRDESMCLSWHAYLEAIGDVEESFGEDFDIVIVTSEDKRYINAANEENIRRRKLKLMGAPSSKTTGSSSLLSNDPPSTYLDSPANWTT